jgi:alkylated DNA repair protein alkB family protein 6
MVLADHWLQPPGCGPTDVALVENFVDGDQADALLAAVLGRRRQGAPAAAAISTTPGWTRAAGRAVRSYGGTVLGSALLPAPLPPWAAALCSRIVDAGTDFGDFGDGSGGSDDVAPNHILANLYPAGAGIMPHADGPAYAPTAAILSLGDDSPGVIRFFAAAAAAGGAGAGAGAGAGVATEGSGDKANPTLATPTPSFSVFLPPRSLLVFRGGAYSAHRHGLDDGVDGDVIDGTVLNPEAARAWAAAATRAGPSVLTTIPRGPCRVSLTVRRVKRVKAGLLRL